MKSWDRQKGESEPAWAAFQAFRDLPPQVRTLRAAYIALQGDAVSTARTAPRHWNDWKKLYKWDERVADFDQEQDRLQVKALRKARTAQLLRFQADVVKESENSSLILRALQSKLALRIQTLDLEEMKDGAVVQLVTALGRALEISHNIRASVLGLDEIAAVIQRDDGRILDDGFDPSEDG